MSHAAVYAVGLDAGASATRCVIGIVEDGVLRLLGYGEARSYGWVKGCISDQKAVADSILAAVQEAEDRKSVV